MTEIALLAEQLGPGFPIAEIALGGGSPNFLEPATMKRLVVSIERMFEVAPDARRSVELDPRSTTAQQLDMFAALGFRSLSASACRTSTTASRTRSAATSRWRRRGGSSSRRARAGSTDINVDIVYGLPRQTEDSFAATLDAILSIAPDRIALFGYAHLPDQRPAQRLVERAGRVLDRYERATLLLAAIERLLGAGYVHLGLDHFARPDSALARAAIERRMVRTFQGYVERRAESILGVGTSAISSTPRAIWQNHPELAPWRDAIDGRRLPIARGVVLDADDRIRGALINRLMCDGEVDLRQLGAQLGVDLAAYLAPELASLAALSQLAAYEPDRGAVVTTALGRLLVRNVCMAFDRYQRGAQRARFSPTI